MQTYDIYGAITIFGMGIIGGFYSVAHVRLYHLQSVEL